VAQTLNRAVAKTNDPDALQSLAEDLSAVAARMEPGAAARASAEAAASLNQALTKTYEPFALQSLAQGLSAVAGRLGPEEATQAAATLYQALSKTNDHEALLRLARALSTVAARLEPEEAARASARAAATLTQAMSTTNERFTLEPVAEGLSAALGDGRRAKRIEAVVAIIGLVYDSQGLPGTPALLRMAAEPFARRLSDQQVVELLKQPLCVGAARRAVLGHLGMRHGRAFADRWEFVRFAEEQRLGLDFITPPQ
jgi:hypothetical protein